MSAESKTTQNHNTIRNWAEKRDGHPARVAETDDLLRIDFDDATPDPNLQRISWDEFFEEFDNHNLTFLYQEQLEDGQMSRFNKFIREN